MYLIKGPASIKTIKKGSFLGNDRWRAKAVKHLRNNAVIALIHYIYSFRHRIFMENTMISWQHPGRPIILASKSPRRKTILAQMGFTFKTIVPPPIDEAAFLDAGDLTASLKALAKEK